VERGVFIKNSTLTKLKHFKNISQTPTLYNKAVIKKQIFQGGFIMNRNDTEFMVQKIRTQYMEKDNTEKDLDLLRELDAEVKLPANVFGYIFGSIGAIIMGAGMSLVMTDIGTQVGISNPMPIGIVIGIIGMIMAIINYPVYKSILSSRKEKYADRILSLSEKLINKEEE